jgi:hypothetical protein
MQFLSPQQIIKQNRIGAGGFGTVYEGTIYGAKCAIKVY